MEYDGCISAVSERGTFYYWDADNKKEISIAIPRERIVKSFFAPYIFGFVTQKGLIYLANHGYDVPVPKSIEDFMCVDWDDFKIKTVVYWRQNRYAIVLTAGDMLYKIPIGIDGEIVSVPEKIRGHIAKAICKTNLSTTRPYIKASTLYYLTWEGSLYRKKLCPDTTKEHLIAYGKVVVDFSVTSFGNDDKYQRIDMIDAKGKIEQS